MTEATRDIVIAALQKSAGILDDPRHGPALLAGQDIQFSEVELDSLSLFEVIMEIEDRMGLMLDADEVADQPTLSALVRFLDETRAAVPG